MQPAVGDPASAGEVGLDDPQTSLPSLPFCDFVIEPPSLEVFKKHVDVALQYMV